MYWVSNPVNILWAWRLGHYRTPVLTLTPPWWPLLPHGRCTSLFLYPWLPIKVYYNDKSLVRGTSPSKTNELIDTMGWGLEPTVQGMVTVPVTVSISP